MRVLILADELFAVREQSLLTRLEVGLTDEGIRVVHAIPTRAEAFAPGEMISRRVTYTHHRFSFGVGASSRSIIRQLAEGPTTEDWEDVNVVHVFGGSAWPLGATLAAELQCPLVLEVWRTGLAQRALTFAAGRDPAPIFIAPDPSIERILRIEPGQLNVRLNPWGVLAPNSVPLKLVDTQAVSAMLVGTGRDRPAFEAAFKGLATLMNAGVDMMVFADALAARRSGLWAFAKSLGVLDRLTIIQDLEGRRDLVMKGDLLIQPEAGGEQRSITLEAMANAMVVIAANDTSVSAMMDAHTCRLVPRPDGHVWAEVLSAVVRDRAASRALGLEARKFVIERRKATDQIRNLIETYTLAVHGETMPFPRSS